MLDNEIKLSESGKFEVSVWRTFNVNRIIGKTESKYKNFSTKKVKAHFF